MRLPYQRESLLQLSRTELLRMIFECRRAIRYHRDQKGDDRCWLDDYLVWRMLDDSPSAPILPFGEAMWRCEEFYVFRRADAADPVPPDAIPDPALWDADIPRMDAGELLDKLAQAQETIRRHRDMPHWLRTIEHDRLLYSVLPEKIPPDFRLPPRNEFLGEAKAPCAGCPSFWRSHANCSIEKHDPHRWGPCE